jgi:hypothetical protein
MRRSRRRVEGRAATCHSFPCRSSSSSSSVRLMMMMIATIFLLIQDIVARAENVADDNPRRRRINDKDNNSNNKNDVSHHFYQRYDHYPPYCSIPQEVEKRRIPPLSTMPSSTNTYTLRHVTAVFRHGARTPWSGNLNCWENYQTDPATAVWNCSLTAFSAPPPASVAAQEGADTTTTTDTSPTAATNNKNGDPKVDDTMMWFEKRYDALLDPRDNLSNHLNGTCQLGQLIDEGYSQEIANGMFLREAYAYYNDDAIPNGNNSSSRTVPPPPPTIGKLLDLSRPEPWQDQVYFRVDDEERTVLSGQLVLRGLFGDGDATNTTTADGEETATMVLHTADFDRDVVDPNERICPRLVELRQRNIASAGYQKLVADHERIIRFQRDVLKPPNVNIEMHAIDCLMTTICTDRPLPASIRDYGVETIDNDDEWDAPYGPNRFQRLYEYDVQKYTYNLKANDAEYAKLGIGPLWYEIVQQLQSVMAATTTSSSVVVPPKLHVISGHDTTVMPLLAALDPNLWSDTEWPAYASLLVLELWERQQQLQQRKVEEEDDQGGGVDGTGDTSSFHFRLIYNGQVLTMKGCASNVDLCDVSVLLARLRDFAVPNPDCQLRDQVPSSTAVPAAAANAAASATKRLVAAAWFGAILGAAAMYFFLVVVLGRRHRHRAGGHSTTTNRPAPLPSDDHDGIIIMTNGNGHHNKNQHHRANDHHDDDDDNLL